MLGHLPLFWHIWVVVIILISLIFLAILVIKIYYPKDKHPEEEVVWDETLIEGIAPPPQWWFWLITSALIFSVLYMIFYPGFGNYKGLFDLTNAKKFTQSKDRINNQYFSKLMHLEKASITQLQNNPEAMTLAKNVYNNNCINCHSKDGLGQNIFPNLKDSDWQWGNNDKDIINTITHGRQAVMPAWQAALGDEGVTQIAKFIQNFKANKNDKAHQLGQQKYQQFCLGCHSINGKGNPALGAPNLTDNIWLYGADINSIKTSIANGRSGIMPAQKNRLTPLQIKLLTAWLLVK